MTTSPFDRSGGEARCPSCNGDGARQPALMARDSGADDRPQTRRLAGKFVNVLEPAPQRIERGVLLPAGQSVDDLLRVGHGRSRSTNRDVADVRYTFTSPMSAGGHATDAYDPTDCLVKTKLHILDRLRVPRSGEAVATLINECAKSFYPDEIGGLKGQMMALERWQLRYTAAYVRSRTKWNSQVTDEFTDSSVDPTVDCCKWLKPLRDLIAGPPQSEIGLGLIASDKFMNPKRHAVTVVGIICAHRPINRCMILFYDAQNNCSGMIDLYNGTCEGELCGNVHGGPGVFGGGNGVTIESAIIETQLR